MLNPRVLANTEFLEEVEVKLASTSRQVILISAFLKTEVLNHLAKFIRPNVDVTIVTRWRLDDLLNGSSDISSYGFCKEKDWCLRIDNQLHAKALLCDQSNLFIGSANFTGKGTHLNGFGNNEISVVMIPTGSEILKIVKFVDSSIILNDKLWGLMSKFIEENQLLVNKREQNIIWPDVILSELDYECKYLWVDECLTLGPSQFFSKNSGRENNYNHDRNLFASDNPDIQAFKRLKIFRWLESVVNENQKCLSFGELSAIMHNSFLTDPKPFRSDVKLLLSVLFEWISYFDIYNISRYNHRQVLNYP